MRFPETWKGVPCADPQLTCRVDQGAIDFELKQSQDDSHALLFQLTNGLGTFSEQRFALSPGSGAAVRATSGQWENSQCLDRQQSFNFNKDKSAMPIGSAFYEYGGRRFLKSGKEWGNILYSRNGGIAVLFSYTPRRELLESILLDEPEAGTFYIDVYEANTGRSLFRRNAPYQGRAISLSQGAFLFADRYVIAPLDPTHQSILVLTLPTVPVPSQVPPVESGELCPHPHVIGLLRW
jgi:hypothetical protein